MADQQNLIELITTDHREVDAAFEQLENGEGTAEHRRSLVDHVIAELVRHSVAEEMYRYPAARDSLPDGDQVADHEVEEHAEAAELMKRFDGMDPSEFDFAQLVKKLSPTSATTSPTKSQICFRGCRRAVLPSNLSSSATECPRRRRSHPHGHIPPPRTRPRRTSCSHLERGCLTAPRRTVQPQQLRPGDAFRLRVRVTARRGSGREAGYGGQVAGLD